MKYTMKIYHGNIYLDGLLYTYPKNKTIKFVKLGFFSKFCFSDQGNRHSIVAGGSNFKMISIHSLGCNLGVSSKFFGRSLYVGEW